jgi:predicted SnoaL-like aldol condensation-catalyzing enzyme
MTSANEALVRKALHELFVQKDASALSRYWSDPYPQHNPGIANGVASLAPLVPFTESYELKRILSEGDLVVAHGIARGWAPQPVVVFDIFLVRDGKITEHWDVMQPLVAETVSGRSQTDGPTEVTDRALTSANKAVVQGLLDDVLYAHRVEKLTTYISETSYAQHNPGVGDNLSGFGAAMAELAKVGLKMAYQKTYRVVAEGNFVFTHSEGEFAGRHVAFADLFRVEGGKIVEHWDCIQDVVRAEDAKNPNGMFVQITK